MHKNRTVYTVSFVRNDIAAARRLTATNIVLFNITVNKSNEIISTDYQAGHLSGAHREMYGTQLISNGNW